MTSSVIIGPAASSGSFTSTGTILQGPGSVVPSVTHRPPPVSYKDAPGRQTLQDLPKSSAVQDVRVVVTEAFDDPGASFTMGLTENPQSLVAEDDVDLSVEGEYLMPASRMAQSAEFVIYDFAPANSAQGSFTLSYDVVG